jgi:hypothetical protein
MKQAHRGGRIMAVLFASLALGGVWCVGHATGEPASETALHYVEEECVYLGFPGAYQPIACVPPR